MRSPFRALSVCLLFVLVGHPSVARAYELLEDYGTFGECDEGVRFERSPTFVAHHAYVARHDAAPAMRDVFASIGDVAGSWVDVRLEIGDAAAPRPFLRDGTNDVLEGNGFLAIGGITAFAMNLVNIETCELIEADIQIIPFPWVYEGPRESGDLYYDTGPWSGSLPADPLPHLFFRPVFLHEALHTLGFAHNPRKYSFMNYGSYPWSSDALPNQIKPLPDDRSGLRAVYASEGSERDVAVLNTWVDQEAVVGRNPGAAIQKLLCAISDGDEFSDSPFAAYCSQWEYLSLHDPLLCPGDVVVARYAIANYGTRPETVREELWLRRDPIAPFAAVSRSATVHVEQIPASTSVLRERRFVVPPVRFGGGTRQLEVRLQNVDGAHVESSAANNSIPLRGALRLGDFWHCARPRTDEPPPMPEDFDVHDCDDPMAAGVPLCP